MTKTVFLVRNKLSGYCLDTRGGFSVRFALNELMAKFDSSSQAAAKISELGLNSSDLEIVRQNIPDIEKLSIKP